MAVYGTIVAGEGDLQHYTSLDANFKSEAEDEADAFIDREFISWDRSEWSESWLPIGVAHLWRKVARRRYRELDLRENPGVSMDTLETIIHDKEEEMMMATRMKSEGFLVAPDGTRIRPAGNEGLGSRSGLVLRG